MAIDPLKDGIRSQVRIDFYGNVHKRLRGTDADKRYATEVAVLKVLEERGCPYVPRLLEEHPEELYFVSTNCGKLATQISKEKADHAVRQAGKGIRRAPPRRRTAQHHLFRETRLLLHHRFRTGRDPAAPAGPRHASSEDPVTPAATTAMTLQWAALTHSGSRKPRNDDSLITFASSPTGAENLPHGGSHSLARHDLVFAVSDGMGGGNAGDLASSLLLKRMSEIIPETFKIAASGFFPDCLAHLADAIRSVHEHINEAAACDHTRGMAATLALAWFTPENLYLANVGDSRIYLSRAGGLQQLSRDHTSAWGQWKRGEIPEVQYRCPSAALGPL